jgi:hypothetical protein
MPQPITLPRTNHLIKNGQIICSINTETISVLLLKQVHIKSKSSLLRQGDITGSPASID